MGMLCYGMACCAMVGTYIILNAVSAGMVMNDFEAIA